MSKFSGFDLEVDQPSRMVINHPETGQPLRDADGNEAWIDLLSADSAKAQAYERKVTQSRLSQRLQQITAEQLFAENIARYANRFVAWQLIDLKGNRVDEPCTEKNAAEFIGSGGEKNWLREQVEAFYATRTNFTRGLSKI